MLKKCPVCKINKGFNVKNFYRAEIKKLHKHSCRKCVDTSIEYMRNQPPNLENIKRANGTLIKRGQTINNGDMK